MFIINSLCCLSESTASVASSKPKFIKKITPDPVIVPNTIHKSIISDNNSSNKNDNLFSNAEDKTPTFPKVFSGN